MSDTDSRQCYWPNHDKAAGVYPCTDDETSHCCGKGSVCLTNGYCLDSGQPYVLSRGGCTSSTWGSGCPTECQDSTPSEGASIINIKFSKGISTYCCGTPIANGTSTACPDGSSPFQLDDSDIIIGRAALANVTTNTTAGTSNNTVLPTTTVTPTSKGSSSGNNDVAIGAGVGVPLGVIALISIIWAIWERRRANKAIQAQRESSWGGGMSAANQWGRQTAPRELSSGLPSELMSSERSEMGGSSK